MGVQLLRKNFENTNENHLRSRSWKKDEKGVGYRIDRIDAMAAGTSKNQ